MRKATALLTSAASVAAMLVVGTATAAHAFPTGCTTSISASKVVTSYCASGTGQHKAYLHYQWASPHNGPGGTMYGEWAEVGAVSTVSPPGAVYVTGYGAIGR
ncbi:hypothetical protein [Spongiactinospora sp. TRM90649]|uniref:hypothetical protein n=1 Tax=Spongiactinospora sp. TRM90649 TaxID=3031114 RepID=UPI0023F7EADE|nr:hypothetical protein [Spongiactinospora sp. TRM90649]MDF5754670.1 hypothetical protein [Spongiactinospora sp. TRM90649]